MESSLPTDALFLAHFDVLIRKSCRSISRWFLTRVHETSEVLRLYFDSMQRFTSKLHGNVVSAPLFKVKKGLEDS